MVQETDRHLHGVIGDRLTDGWLLIQHKEWGPTLHVFQTLPGEDRMNVRDRIIGLTDKLKRLGFDYLTVLKTGIPGAFENVGYQRFSEALEIAEKIAASEVTVREQPDTSDQVVLQDPGAIFNFISEPAVRDFPPETYSLYLEAAGELMRATIDPDGIMKLIRENSAEIDPGQMTELLRLAKREIVPDLFQGRKPFIRYPDNYAPYEYFHFFNSVDILRKTLTHGQFSDKIRGLVTGELGSYAILLYTKVRPGLLDKYPDIANDRLEDIGIFVKQFHDIGYDYFLAQLILERTESSTDPRDRELLLLKIQETMAFVKQHNMIHVQSAFAYFKNALDLILSGRKPKFVYHPEISHTEHGMNWDGYYASAEDDAISTYMEEWEEIDEAEHYTVEPEE